MAREKVATYRVGETFKCVKRPIIGAGEVLEFGEPCGADIVIHKFHWCAQICPVCLANYHIGHGTDSGLYLDTAGFYPPETAARVRAEIAANGGQHIPQFK